MIKLNINEIKAQFSKYVDLVEGGETVVICKRNLPVAEIRSIHKPIPKKPVLGSAKNTFVIPPEFYQPLPDDVLGAFEGLKAPKR